MVSGGGVRETETHRASQRDHRVVSWTEPKVKGGGKSDCGVHGLQGESMRKEGGVTLFIFLGVISVYTLEVEEY